MSSVCEVFLGISSLAELEAALNDNEIASLNEICDNDSKKIIKQKLEEVLGDGEIISNAKTRRRLKRYVESIDIRMPRTVAVPGRGAAAPVSKRPESAPVEPVDLATSLQLLRSCKSMGDVQKAMDSMLLPEPLNIDSGALATLKGPIKTALQNLLTTEGITNKILRRRMTRMIFVLSSPEEQAELTRQRKEASAQLAAAEATAAAAAAAGGSSAERIGHSSVQAVSSEPVVFVLPQNACSIAQCLALLRQAGSVDEQESVISRTTTHASVNEGVTMDCVVALKDLLADLIESVGAKLRRRIKRLQEQLEAETVRIQSERAAAVATAPSTPVHAAPTEEAVGEPVRKQARTAMVLVDAHAPAPPRVSVAPAAAMVKEEARGQEEADAAPAGPPVPLEGIIEQVQRVTSPQELESVLANVKPNSGNMRSRRLLKRAIERSVASAEMAEKINSKVRRRVTRVLDMLAPDPNRQSAEEANNAKKKLKKEGNAGDAEDVGVHKKVPYILFVGQLNFGATADDLKQFLMSKGIEGDIKVRILTFKDSGESRGSAFVEVEGAREMHKCVALHMTPFMGRMLNIEKSCGGSNRETRAAKIEQKREEQKSKVREPINRLLEEHNIDAEILGVDLKVALYNSAPNAVGDALKRYSALPESDRKLSTLHQLVTRSTTRARAKSSRRQDTGESAGGIGHTDADSEEEEGYGGGPGQTFDDDSDNDFPVYNDDI